VDALQKLIQPEADPPLADKKVRNIAKVKFRKEPEILNEFSSITRKSGGTKEEPLAPATEQPK
jgi:hypothetical protein